MATSDGMNRLNAVIAALAQVKSSLQPATLRTFLEYGLERLQAIEEEHYVFLAECAQLAASNVQDVRLQDLEKRVRDAENAERSWGETVADMAFNVAIQVAVLAALEGAAALVIAVAGRRALRDAVDTAARNLRGTQIDLAAVEADASEAQSAIAFLLSLKAKDKLASPMTATIKISSRGETRTVRRDNIEDWVGVVEELVTRREDAVAKVQLAQGMQSGKAADLTRVLQAFESGRTSGDSDAIEKYWDGWRDFVGGERGNLLMGPVQTSFEKVSTELVRAKGETESADPYLGSTVTGHFLTWISLERLRVQEQYSNFRTAVRYAPDADLTSGSEIVRFLAYLVAEQLPKWQSLHLAACVARPWLVSGFEAAFWREYLAANGMLVVKHDVAYNGVFDYLPPFRGDIRAGHLLKEDAPVGQSTVRSDFFHGVVTMTELQADYLFRRYAKRWVESLSDPSSVLYFEYQSENYTSAVAEVFGFLPNVARTRRIDEMRVMVILYFVGLDAFKPDERLNPLLGIAEALGSAEDSMRGTVGIPPGPVDIERINADAIETAHALEALISLGDDEATRQVAIAQLAFVDMLTDLNQDIQAYLLLTSGVYAYERTWDQRTQDELYSEIQDEQQTLKQTFNDLLQIAADDPDRVSQIGVAYQDAVTAITHWTPQSDWVWYGATPEEAGP